MKAEYLSVEARTVLNRLRRRDEWYGCAYTVNPYRGCEHGCAYCYARFMQRFHPHPEPWGEFVDVKANAVEVLERQLRRARPGNVFMSSACDGWQPLEADLELTRQCCDLLLAHGFQVNVLTKSGLALRDLDIFEGRTARVGVTITTLDERLRQRIEEIKKQQAKMQGMKKSRVRMDEIGRSPEGWWKTETMANRKRFIIAYYAEESGDMKILRVKFNPCPHCAGRGYLEQYGASGEEDKKIPCEVCKTLGFERTVVFK